MYDLDLLVQGLKYYNVLVVSRVISTTATDTLSIDVGWVCQAWTGRSLTLAGAAVSTHASISTLKIVDEMDAPDAFCCQPPVLVTSAVAIATRKPTYR
jgi:hypothetical protein